MKKANRKIVLLLTTLAVLFICAIPSIAQITIAPSGGLHWFDGAGSTGWAPPDPNAAVGPNHIVQVVNNSMVIFNKSGGVISSKDLNTFFSAGTGGDPHVVYDEISRQFLVENIWLNGSGNMIGVCFASSVTSDPTGGWRVMYISVPGFWDGYGGNGIGYNADAYVVHVNGFNNQFAVIPVGSNTYTLVTAPSGIRIGRPASMPSSVSGGPFYFVEGNDDGANGTGGAAGNVEVVQVNNIVSGSRSFNDYQVHVNNSGVSVVYVSWRNNQLAMVGSAGTSVQWELLSTSGTPSLLQSGSISSPDGGSVDLPSVAIDPNGDLGVNYTSVAGGMAMYVSGRGALDSAGTMRRSVAAAVAGKSDGRIGDYSSCVVDVDSLGVAQNTFWACGEWMNSGSQFDWRTRITQFAMVGAPPAPGVYSIGSYGDLGTALQATLDTYYSTYAHSYANGVYEVAATPYSPTYSYQHWIVAPIGGGQYHIINQAENMSLQATGDPYWNGQNYVGGADKIALTPNYWNISQQVWQISAASSGYSLGNPTNGQNLQSSYELYKGSSGNYQVLGSPYAWGVGAFQEWNFVWVGDGN